MTYKTCIDLVHFVSEVPSQGVQGFASAALPCMHARRARCRCRRRGGDLRSMKRLGGIHGCDIPIIGGRECCMPLTTKPPAAALPDSKATLFATLRDLVEAALDGNSFRTSIILEHVASSYPSIASSCNAAEEQKLRAALALPPPHDTQLCQRALVSLGFSLTPRWDKGALVSAAVSCGSKRQRKGQQGGVSYTDSDTAKRPAAAAAAAASAAAAAARVKSSAAPNQKQNLTLPSSSQSPSSLLVNSISFSAAKNLPSQSATSSSLPSDRLRIVEAIFQKLSAFASRAASSLPSMCAAARPFPH